MTTVVKREGNKVPYNKEKIKKAVYKAVKSTRESEKAEEISQEIADLVDREIIDLEEIEVEGIQDIVEDKLIEKGFTNITRNYIRYRQKREMVRANIHNILDLEDIFNNYIHKNDWEVNENANMDYSLQGLNNRISSSVTENIWLNSVYCEEIAEAHREGKFHLHDLGLFAVYCCGWDIEQVLTQGFGGVKGKPSFSPPKHFKSALGQIVNFLYTLQGEAAGAQAISSFDTYLAPLVYYDGLNYEQIKQDIQNFICNLNISTRVGFQCLSEDTEILSVNGWKKYNELSLGEEIATFNINNKNIEYLPIQRIFNREYSGKMYNLKNRINDQLVSPNHRIVRKKFNSEEYIIESIEDTLKMESDFIIPVATNGAVKRNNYISEKWARLIAWIISEGTYDRGERGTGRISIYQSEIKSEDNYFEIVNLCNELGIKYSESCQKGWGDECQVIRLNAESTRRVLDKFETDKEKGIKFIPNCILEANGNISKIFIETYMKADGSPKWNRITTTSETICDHLTRVIINAGYGVTVRLDKRKGKGVSKKDLYVLRVLKNKDTYINKVEEVNYEGTIWCPTTDNGTVIARRNGKTFITGNCPFTNLTLDLKCPKFMADKPVIIGGEVKWDRTYGEFQEYMDLINKAFIEVMYEGDNEGRIYSFPIPTYNITEDTDWDSEIINDIMKLTAKYGTPYFQNFIGSDLNPEDFRSMCCRLRLDNRELRKRGGGLFGSAPLTGSIGVVTINMARLGYLHKNDIEGLKKELKYLMDLAKESLIIKRKVLENNTETGLYPYSKVYLKNIKQASGSYWNNHFSTIGINGMNECIMNFTGNKGDITTEFGQKTALEILEFMNNRLIDYQQETGQMFNLEATPAESTSYRLAQKDRKKYKDIICQGTEKEPYYTNSTQLPVNFTEDIFEALDLQEELQSKYTGGCVEKGTLVMTNKGILPIEYIHENFAKLSPIKVLSYNVEESKSEMDIILETHKIDVSKKNKIRVQGEKGLNIVTSDWHPFFTIDEDGKVIEKRADELQEGDKILCNSDNIIREEEREGDLNETLAWALGYGLSITEGNVEKILGKINRRNINSLLEGVIKEGRADLRRGKVICSIGSETICRYLMSILTKAGLTFEVIRGKETISIEISLKEFYKFSSQEKEVKYVEVIQTDKVEVDDEMFYDLTVANNHNYLSSNGSVFVYIHNTVFHGFFKDKVDDIGAIKSLIKNILYKYKIPYFTYTPTFSICKNHGYLKGEERECPICGEKTEIWSRVVGFYRPVENWNNGKKEEYNDRAEFHVC